jgi:geranylgeranyl pyrophosphate synthase
VLDRVGAADLDADEIDRIQQVIVDTGALGELERTVADLADVAVRALDAVDITDEARGELAALAHFVATRGE